MLADCPPSSRSYLGLCSCMAEVFQLSAALLPKQLPQQRPLPSSPLSIKLRYIQPGRIPAHTFMLQQM